MTPEQHLEAATKAIVERTQGRFERYRQRTREATDKLFVKLFIGQWLFAIVIALTYSPASAPGRPPTSCS
jgi:hypothetical protein